MSMLPERQLDYLYTMRLESEKSRRRRTAFTGSPTSDSAILAQGGRLKWGKAAAIAFSALIFTCAFYGMRVSGAPDRGERRLSSFGFGSAAKPLTVEALHARLIAATDRPTLVVEGEVANLTAKIAKSQDLRITLLGDDGSERYSWILHPSQLQLPAGERTKFVARLESPPAGVVDAVVTMVDQGS